MPKQQSHYSDTDINVTHTGEDPQFSSCRAVELAEQVLIYDLSHPLGRDAYNSLLQHCADRFFDKGTHIERIGFYDLHPLFDQDTWVQGIGGLNLNMNHRGRDFSLKNLLEQRLYDRSMIGQAERVKEYDMRPNAENYSLFLTGENVQFRAATRTFDIAILDHIARNGYPTAPLPAEWRCISPYIGQFNDLAQQIHSSSNPEVTRQLQAQTQERAHNLLDSDFPDRRRMEQYSPQVELKPSHDAQYEIHESRGIKL